MSNRKVLVTGGTRGIGYEIVKAFAKKGDAIAFTYISSESQASKVASELKALGASEAITAKCDVSQETDVVQLAKLISEKWGELDVMIANAGISQDQLVMRLKTEDWDRILNTNLRGAMLCAREFSRLMLRKRDGVMLMMSSVIGQMGNVGQSAYAASKAGLVGLTKSLARELAPRNIRVNAIAPGYIETEMMEVIDEKVKSAIIEKIPLGRTGRAEEVAALCLYLSDPLASYMTGQVIGINGGLYI